MRWLAVVMIAVSCSAPQVVSDLNDESPAPDLGRPAWVRYPARVGATTGAIVGGAASIVLLPITWPISLLADEPLGYSKREFLFMPVSFAASAGQFAIGAPLDMLDFTLYRAWFDDYRATDYEYEPQQPPISPTVRAAEDAESDGSGEPEKTGEPDESGNAEKAGEPDK